MEDKELLELAAKAAGLKPTENCNGQLAWTTGIGSGCFLWNPLTDDGDALRLAVKLYLDVMTCCQQRGEIQIGGAVARTTFQPVGDDPQSATRRAIVRAAAEIGRAMP